VSAEIKELAARVGALEGCLLGVVRSLGEIEGMLRSLGYAPERRPLLSPSREPAPSGETPPSLVQAQPVKSDQSSVDMIIAVPTKGKKIRPVRHHGIGQAAATLGVTRHHLYRVITGERKSPRIERWLRKHFKGIHKEES
jgi:hypothetical protein